LKIETERGTGIRFSPVGGGDKKIHERKKAIHIFESTNMKKKESKRWCGVKKNQVGEAQRRKRKK